MLITEEYRRINADLHRDKPEYGTSGKRWARQVEGFIEMIGARSVLDYGCGKQTLRDALPHRDITGYDPAFEDLSASPIAHDLVVCSDVLEHIEPDCIDAVLDHLKVLAIKGVFLLVATVPAYKHLPDGRNAHILQRPSEWWMPRIQARWDLNTFNRIAIQHKDRGKEYGEFIVTGMPTK